MTSHGPIYLDQSGHAILAPSNNNSVPISTNNNNSTAINNNNNVSTIQSEIHNQQLPFNTIPLTLSTDKILNTNNAIKMAVSSVAGELEENAKAIPVNATTGVTVALPENISGELENKEIKSEVMMGDKEATGESLRKAEVSEVVEGQIQGGGGGGGGGSSQGRSNSYMHISKMLSNCKDLDSDTIMKYKMIFIHKMSESQQDANCYELSCMYEGQDYGNMAEWVKNIVNTMCS